MLFIGIKPSSHLRGALLSSGYTITEYSHAEVTGKLQKPASFDVVVLSFTPRKTISLIEDLKTRFPSAWISVVMGRTQLKEPNHYQALLESPHKNDVWLKQSWELTFWFGIQRARNHHALLNQVIERGTEVKRLEELTQKLSDSSGELIEKLEKNVGLASHIQRSLLPRYAPAIPGISLSVKYMPAAGVGGDYYDVFEFGDKKRFGILIADSKTHGMAAALLSVLIKVRIEEVKDRFPDSKSFTAFLNEEIQKFHTKELAPLSLLFGILDRSSLQFDFTSAGSLAPYLWRSGKSVPLSVKHNPPLGSVQQYEFRENTTTLHPGDLLILYTDGFEAPLKEASKNNADPISKVLEPMGETPDPLDVQNELMGIVDAYATKNELKDDLTMLNLAISARALYVARKPKA